jgi:tRNA (adenine37-N6)-methyltransferase
MKGALAVTPIGVLSTPFKDKAEIPRQASVAAEARGVIELEPDRDLADAIDGIESFDTIWVLFWFHENGGHYRPKVAPPRSSERRGVLATRSPHRPNPIGLSAVRLERVEGLRLFVAGVDMLDGTPVLDIKPYIAYADAVVDAKAGWLDEASDPAPRFRVVWEEPASTQLSWLAENGHDSLRRSVETLLETGPKPHAYRRIRELGAGRYQLAVKSWRLTFRSEGERALHVEAVVSGYRPAQLFAPLSLGSAVADNDDLMRHRAFLARFGP